MDFRQGIQMARRSAFWIVVLSLLCLGVVGLSSAQVLTGTITGTVTDPTGAVIPNAKVTAVDTATARTYTATTNSAGGFVFTNLPYGIFRVTVEMPGFAKFIVDKVQVNVGQNSEVLAKMTLARTGTEVVVEAAQEVVQTESSEVKNSIDRRQVMELPLPGRNPIELVRTMAGASAPTASGIGDVFVHGLRGNATNITQDGVNVADNFVKTSSFFALSAPTVDTVGEMTFSTGGSGSDTGFGATQVSIVTQRGQNALHGSLFWFQRTSFLNANTYFNNASKIPTPFQLQNRIGYSVGGPIYIPKIYNGKNKTWFFSAFEAFREPRAQSRTRTVLSDPARTGQFTYRRVDNGQMQTVSLLSLPGVPFTTINSAVMNFYNSLVPPANTDAGCSAGDSLNIRCFIWNLSGKNMTNRYTARLDHQLTDAHSIEFVYNQSNFLTAEDFLNGIERNFPNSASGGQESKRQVFTWAFHSTFGNNKTNTARVGITRAPVTFTIKESYAATGGVQLQFAGVTDPTITSTNLPQGRNTPVRQFMDNFAWVKGHHTLEFGGEYRAILANSFFFNTVPARVSLGSNSSNPDNLTTSTFPGGISASDLGRAQTVYRLVTGMLGAVNQGFNHTSPTSGFVPGVPRTITPWQNNLAFFGKDSFRFRPNLTLQYGLRWEYQGVFDLRNKLILQPDDRMAAVFGPAGLNNYFNPVTTPAASDVLLNFAGGRNGKPLYNRDLNNFAPFAGVSWDPFGDGKTAIRLGGAMHYTQDGFTVYQTASTGNLGLFTVATNSTPTGVFSPSTLSSIMPATPPDVFPVSQKSNFAVSNGSNLWTFKKDLATPYVIEWNLAIQREIGKRVTVEARYIGNHSVKLIRSNDINEINLLDSPYTNSTGQSVANILTEFKNAQNNLAICRASNPSCANFSNAGLAGQVPLPILQALFSGLSASRGFANSGFVTNLDTNAVGSMFDTLRRSPTYAANRASFPLNFFVPNPWAASSILVGNNSWGNYHGLELEVRRRFSSGLFFQANYTWSKALTDTVFLTSQQEVSAYRTLHNPKLDKFRAAFDTKHVIAANFLYPLPIGRGQKLLGNAGSLLDKLVGGWNLQGITRWSTGSPFTISSGRWTLGSLQGQNETAVLRNMPPAQLQKFFGVFKTSTGVYWLDPNSGLFTISGSTSRPVMCTAGQTTPCWANPDPGGMGSFNFLQFSGPSFFDQDASIIKRIGIPELREGFNVELRLEAFNALNHPSFAPGVATLTSSTFGQLNTIVDTARGGGVNSRIVQWAVRVNF